MGHGCGCFVGTVLLLRIVNLVTILLSSSCCTFALTFNLDTKIRVGSTTSIKVPNPSNAITDNVPLTQYMRLPVEQYALVPMPLNSTLSRIPGGNTTSDFELVVPPVRFLWLDVQPVVHAVVTLQDDKVVIAGDRCSLHGSPFISKVQLNDRFDFRVRAELTWNDTCSTTSNDDAGRVKKTDAINGNNARLGSSSTIFGDASIKVDVDVPRPFNAIPRRGIEKIGNKAMQLSLSILLRSFMKGLAGDYQRWASDPEYRKQRAELAEEKDGRSIAYAAQDEEHGEKQKS